MATAAQTPVLSNDSAGISADLSQLTVRCGWMAPFLHLIPPLLPGVSVNVVVDNGRGLPDKTADVNVFVCIEPPVIAPAVHARLLCPEWCAQWDAIAAPDPDVVAHAHAKKYALASYWVDAPPPTAAAKWFGVQTIMSGKRGAAGHALRHLVRERWPQSVPGEIFTGAVSAGGILRAYPADRRTCFTSMFHLVIENSRGRGYFTEKIMDAFRMRCVPIYWGAPNIGDTFDVRGIIVVETLDQILACLAALTPDDYTSRLAAVDANAVLAEEVAEGPSAYPFDAHAPQKQFVHLAAILRAAQARFTEQRARLQPIAAPMLAVTVRCGLGNRMFGCAAALGLAASSGRECVVLPDFSEGNRHSATWRDEDAWLLRGIAHKLPEGRPPVTHVHERIEDAVRHVPFVIPPPEDAPLVLVHGYLQAFAYSASLLPELRARFLAASPFTTPARATLEPLTCGALFCHVRRGDYLACAATHDAGLWSGEYYTAALARFPTDAPLLVFSDDVPWCRSAASFSARPGVTFVGDEVTPLDALQLMAACTLGGITANSSLSAWAGYLCASPGKRVIMPATWFRGQPREAASGIYWPGAEVM